MAINDLFPVGDALRRAEIVPRTEPHLLEDIRGALKKELSNGMHVQINCLTDKKVSAAPDGVSVC